MAKYKITDPQTGQSVEYESASEPTPELAEKVFAAAGFRGQATPQTPVDSRNLGQKIGETGFGLAAPRTLQAGKNVVGDIVSGNMPGQTLQDVAATAFGPLGIALGGNQRQKEVGAAGAELASYALPVKNLKQLAPLGALVGGVQQAVTPENIDLLQRVLRTGGGAGVGYIGGKLMEKAVGLLQGPGIKRVGEDLIGSQYNVPRSGGNALKIRQTIGGLADYGITNIDDIPKAAAKVTGADGVISKVTREAAAQTGDINTVGLRQIAADLASDPSIPVGQDNKVRQFLNETIKDNSSDVLDMIRKLESKASGLLRGRPQYMIPETDKAMANTYRSFAGELQTRLEEAGVGDKIINLIKQPKYLEVLNEVSPKLAQQAAAVKSLPELRSLAAPFVRGSQLEEITNNAMSYGFQNIAGQAKGVGKLIQNPLNVLAMPLSSNPVNAAVGGVVRGVGGMAQKMGSGMEKISPMLLKLLMTQGGNF